MYYPLAILILGSIAQTFKETYFFHLFSFERVYQH